MNKIKALVLKHKFLSAIIIIVLLVGIYFLYAALTKPSNKPTYVSSAVEKGTITTSVSGSGQVSASHSINLQFKGSGTLVYLAVQNGQTVSTGQLIAQLDTTTAQQSIQSAQSSLQSTQISLQKIKGPDSAPVPLNKQNAENSLNQDYQTAYNTVATSFIDLPAVMTSLNNILFGYTFNNYQQNIDYYAYSANNYDQGALTYKTSASQSYQAALTAYNKNFLDYKAIPTTADNATIDSMLTETYSTVKNVSQALKDANNLIQVYKDVLTQYNVKTNPQADTDLTSLNNAAGKIDADKNSLLNIQNSLQSDQQAIINADLDLQSAQLNLQSQENSLANAKQNLSDYFIYAPFSGTVGNVTVQKLDNVGSGTAVATLITNQKIANIPLNEVDVAKVQAGQKVIITFDALPDLSVAGQVAQINPIGTVSQGVVTYTVQIAFDTQDSRVKPGMSMSANIITNVKQDVLLVPNSAVKTQGTTKYVQVLVNGAPQQKVVTTGLSNDSQTEITSGLSQGDNVITQTIAGSSAAATTRTATNSSFGGASSILRLGGGAGAGR